jgi:hypothetical protein
MAVVLRNGFLTLACLLLMAHSVIPHEHSTLPFLNYSAKNTSEIRIFDFIKIVISEDLGANHLEDYIHHQGDDGRANWSGILSAPFIFDEPTPALISRLGVDQPHSTKSDPYRQPDRTRGSPLSA